MPDEVRVVSRRLGIHSLGGDVFLLFLRKGECVKELITNPLAAWL
jgi:hypothetical protein